MKGDVSDPYQQCLFAFVFLMAFTVTLCIHWTMRPWFSWNTLELHGSLEAVSGRKRQWARRQVTKCMTEPQATPCHNLSSPQHLRSPSLASSSAMARIPPNYPTVVESEWNICSNLHETVFLFFFYEFFVAKKCWKNKFLSVRLILPEICFIKKR